MNDTKKADEVLDFTFDYLDKVLKEENGGRGKSVPPSNRARPESEPVKEKEKKENGVEDSSFSGK